MSNYFGPQYEKQQAAVKAKYQDIIRKYENIMAQEVKLSLLDWRIMDSANMFDVAQQLGEIALNGLVPRLHNRNCGTTELQHGVADESDGAHANLLAAIVDRAFCFRYGAYCNYTEDGYSYREVMEVIRRHNLPGNIHGNMPDDENDDDKLANDSAYWQDFSRLSPSCEIECEKRINRLLTEVKEKTSFTGKLIHVADKVATILIALCRDRIGHKQVRYANAKNLTELEIAEMDLCDFTVTDKEKQQVYLVSEMRTVDFFKLRSTIDNDDTSFLTALIVMYTLQAHNNIWYPWREKDYSKEYYI